MKNCEQLNWPSSRDISRHMRQWHGLNVLQVGAPPGVLLAEHEAFHRHLVVKDHKHSGKSA